MPSLISDNLGKHGRRDTEAMDGGSNNDICHQKDDTVTRRPFLGREPILESGPGGSSRTVLAKQRREDSPLGTGGLGLGGETECRRVGSRPSGGK